MNKLLYKWAGLLCILLVGCKSQPPQAETLMYLPMPTCYGCLQKAILSLRDTSCRAAASVEYRVYDERRTARYRLEELGVPQAAIRFVEIEAFRQRKLDYDYPTLVRYPGTDSVRRITVTPSVSLPELEAFLCK